MRRNRFLIVILILCVFSVGSVGIFALMQEKSDSVVNSFNLGEISCKIEEDFNGTVKKDVTVKNTGNGAAFIRSNIIVTWMSDDGSSVYWKKPELGKDYTMSINDTDWSKGGDGYYYHNDSVNSGESTSVLIEEAKLIDGVTPPDGYYLSVEVISSAIQANPSDALDDVWSTR